MFNIGGGELMVIALIALIVVGPEQLPGVMRRVGQTVNRLRAMSLGLRDEFMHGMDEFDPRTWMEDDATSARGTGGADDPIVPRGYANAASGEVRASVTGSNDTDPVVDALVEPVVDPVAADGDATTDETTTDETTTDETTTDETTTDETTTDETATDETVDDPR